MDRVPEKLERFIRAVHRRHVILRVVERAGIGLLCGCAIAVLVVAVMVWRGQDAWNVAAIAIGIGAIVGAIWGISHRPSALSAASEADRQLQTSDLLATAWAMRSSPANDPFQQTVLSHAAARCERVHPSTVILHKLGVRAWGGIGLAVAFVATLAALSSAPVGAHDRQGSEAAQSKSEKRAVPRAVVDFAADVDRPQHRTELSPEDAMHGNNVLDGQSTTAENDQSKDAQASDGSKGTSQETSGTGAAQGTTQTPQGARVERPTDASASATNPRTGAVPSPGVGRSAKNLRADDSAFAGIVTSDNAVPSSRSVAPWKRDSWPQAVESARRQLTSCRVPDEYRDVVREYFDISTAPTSAERP